MGQVPVLDDGGTFIADSNAILIYVAKKFGKTDWLPEDPRGAAAVQRWLSVAAGQIASGPAAARLINVFGAKLNAEDVIKRAYAILTVLDEELNGRQWIATDRPTVADVALYSYVDRAPEGNVDTNVDTNVYSHVTAWLNRIRALPGFVEFTKTRVGLQM